MERKFLSKVLETGFNSLRSCSIKHSKNLVPNSVRCQRHDLCNLKIQHSLLSFFSSCRICSRCEVHVKKEIKVESIILDLPSFIYSLWQESDVDMEMDAFPPREKSYRQKKGFGNKISKNNN